MYVIPTHKRYFCLLFNEFLFLLQLTKGIFDLKPGDADVPKVVASFKKKFMKCSQAFRESNECFDFLSDCYAIIQNNPVEIWSNVKASENFCNV